MERGVGRSLVIGRPTNAKVMFAMVKPREGIGCAIVFGKIEFVVYCQEVPVLRLAIHGTTSMLWRSGLGIEMVRGDRVVIAGDPWAMGSRRLRRPRA
jgi:hypothetical protein